MIFIDVTTARGLLDGLALLLLATTLGSIIPRQQENSIRLLALQGLLLSLAAAVVALATGTAHAYLAVAMTVVVKVIVVPGILLFALREVRVSREVHVILPQRQAFLIALGLVLVAYYAVEPLRTLDGFITRNALPAALSMLLIALFTMMIRKKALHQVAGIVAMENGIYLLAIVASHELPLALELGVAVDVAVGAVVMGVVARQIHRAFDTVNTDRLRTLRG